ncbi:uncharacterized protein PFL1_02522 [Pseudozyma flocculosa PF-1]|uniref:ABM domain-containing protein n=2 Tax=Pseudozyma flocculosa TaxID=84751 RepID=A0A5C3EZD0_9BASI|nr:uncharacterized protein PFL1_02522 [Pseudozyma flocculosa PF-1]EPQ29849.1 hypothetical protein PFL1_02522 [Pseudozyma flocculosa PF-1]SPO37145.1 uncharacterized protein PSFLO_02617 [Pseudozyma flocculosa]
MVYTLICHVEVKPGFEQNMADFLRKAAEIYKKTPETIDWLVHQSESDDKKFAIVERFETEASQEYHLAEPFWATFNPTVEPWLAKPIEILRFNEL